MGLSWNWTDKMGEVTLTTSFQGERKEWTFNIYACNGLALELYEYEENGQKMYSMHSFWVSEDHLKNMLGLNKGYDNCYKGERLAYRLDARYKQTQTILKNFMKAMSKDGMENVTITVYDGGERK